LRITGERLSRGGKVTRRIRGQRHARGQEGPQQGESRSSGNVPLLLKEITKHNRERRCRSRSEEKEHLVLGERGTEEQETPPSKRDFQTPCHLRAGSGGPKEGVEKSPPRPTRLFDQRGKDFSHSAQLPSCGSLESSKRKENFFGDPENGRRSAEKLKKKS